MNDTFKIIEVLLQIKGQQRCWHWVPNFRWHPTCHHGTANTVSVEGRNFAAFHTTCTSQIDNGIVCVFRVGIHATEWFTTYYLWQVCREFPNLCFRVSRVALQSFDMMVVLQRTCRDTSCQVYQGFCCVINPN